MSITGKPMRKEVQMYAVYCTEQMSSIKQDPFIESTNARQKENSTYFIHGDNG